MTLSEKSEDRNESSAPEKRMFTNPDGSPSITAGSKMAFVNTILALKGDGWTGAAKALAVTYFDLSEKKGYAFARRKYLSFRIKASLDTISTANSVIEASGLFLIKYRANNSLRVTPNLDAIELAYEKYVADHAAFKRLEDEWWNPEDERDEESDYGTEGTTFRSVDGKSVEVDGDSDEGSRKLRRGSSENPSRNPSRYSLHQNPPSKPSGLRTRSDERVETISGFGEHRPSGALADVLDLSAWVDELEKNLPPFEPFGDFKPVGQERSRRGAIQQLKKLRRLDWRLDEIRQYLDAYRRDFDRQAKTNFKKRGQCGKTLASLLTQLVDQCYPETRNTDDGEVYGWNIPERFLRKPEAPAAGANDNAQAVERKAAGT